MSYRQHLAIFLEDLINDMEEFLTDASEALTGKVTEVTHDALLKLGESLFDEWKSVVHFAYDDNWADFIDRHDWPDNHIQAFNAYMETL